MTQTSKELPRIRARALPVRHREFFIENLQMLIAAGLPMDEVLAAMQEVSQSRRFHRLLKKAEQQVSDGMPLWEALARSGFVSVQTAALIRVGEQSGQLAENLEIAARLERSQITLQQHFKSALMYPLFVVTLTLGIALGVTWFLLPRLAVMFSRLGAELPPITRYLLNAGVYLQAHGKIVVPLMIGMFAISIYLLFFAPLTRMAGYRLLFALPGTGRLLKEIEIAKFGYLLSALLSAGLPINKAFEMLISSSDAPQFRKLYRRLYQSLGEGYGFRTSLGGNKSHQRLLPAAVRQMIIAGERSGNLAQTMQKLAGIYEERTLDTSKRVEVMMEPVMLVVVWAFVMALAITVILPIYNLLGRGFS